MNLCTPHGQIGGAAASLTDRLNRQLGIAERDGASVVCQSAPMRAVRWYEMLSLLCNWHVTAVPHVRELLGTSKSAYLLELEK